VDPIAWLIGLGSLVVPGYQDGFRPTNWTGSPRRRWNHREGHIGLF